jgi:ribosome maturation factor RimP
LYGKEFVMFEKLEGLIKVVCTDCGVGYYDLEIKNTQHGLVFCVFITKVNGVNITDCGKVSRELQMALEKDTSFDNVQYTLEVSSPGLERPLKLKKHYLSSINEWLKVSYVLDEKRDTVFGKLVEVHQDFIIILKDENNQPPHNPSNLEGRCKVDDTIRIPFSSIKKAKTFFKEIKKES